VREWIERASKREELGSFCSYVVKILYEIGHEVVAIDEDKAWVDDLHT